MVDGQTTGRFGDTDASQVKDVLFRVVTVMAPAQVDEVRPQHKFVGDLAFDSLRMLELASVLDELFGLETMLLGDEQVTATVGDLLSYVEKMVEEGQANCPEAQQAEAVLHEFSATGPP